MIDTADSRFAKAVAIADQASKWLKCRGADGKKAYGVPSQSTPDHYHLTTQTSCTCEDARRHAGALLCKHALAVQIHVARAKGWPAPASDTIDGLEQMVIDRHPVLDMIREPDGSVRWERHEHASGEAFYLPRYARPQPVADATTYERIFGKEA